VEYGFISKRWRDYSVGVGTVSNTLHELFQNIFDLAGNLRADAYDISTLSTKNDHQVIGQWDVANRLTVPKLNSCILQKPEDQWRNHTIIVGYHDVTAFTS
jgi:hypothetical protein